LLKNSAKFYINYKKVGVAEPRIFPRKNLVKFYKETIHEDKIFSDFKEILKIEHKIADCVIIALPGTKYNFVCLK
jgi:hypothetical protein